MKCPKCGYLGFESVHRCRNCGYDFSLAEPVALPELPMRRDTSGVNPLDDLVLSEPEPSPDAEAFISERDSDLDRLIGGPPAGNPVPPAAGADPVALPAELPLFGPPIPEDVPLITRASAPRPPLAVRRATPETPRLRTDPPRNGALELTLDADPAPFDSERSPRARRADSRERAPAPAPADVEVAGVGARIAAVAIDLTILAAIDALVIYFTMKVCGLQIGELNILPKAPLIVFLLLQNGGYLAAFTVKGQTLGKMAAGIKVIAAESDVPLDLSRATLRTVLWLALAVPAGLGFVSALFSQDRRGLHDRFAGTRVVRASA